MEPNGESARFSVLVFRSAYGGMSAALVGMADDLPARKLAPIENRR